MVLQDKSIRRRQGIKRQRGLIPMQINQEPAIQTPQRKYFSISNRRSFERITTYVWDTKKE